MPRLVNRTPAYCKHKPSGQAIVTLNGRQIYLGPHGTRASKAAYDREIGEWLAAGRGTVQHNGAYDTTITELVAAFWKHAQVYYAGDNRGELNSHRIGLRILRRLYGPTRAAEFGPLAMKAVQGAMVKEGWSRKYVNSQVGRIKRAFKWAVGNEMVPMGLLHGLQAVDGLRQGKSEAPESEPVRPVDVALVTAVMKIAPPPVAAMIGLQILTGMRPGEVCQMRLADIDRSGPEWLYRPTRHKTQHHGHTRMVPLGERSQLVLAPYLDREPSAYLFSPAEALAWVMAERGKARKTPLSCGNRPGSNRVRKPKRGAGEKYTSDSYGRAIARLADRAFPPTGELALRKKESIAARDARLTAAQRVELAAWRDAHRWHPHQLRHNFATTVRASHGLEVAQVLLGHATLSAAQIYAEKNTGKALEVVKSIG